MSKQTDLVSLSQAAASQIDGVTGSTGYVTISTNGAERLRVSNTGNVGIGTGSPTNPLHVVGEGTFTRGLELGVAGVDATSYISQYRSTVETIWGPLTTRALFGTVSNHDLAFQTNNTEKMRLSAAGRVGIGTTSPTADLSVGSTTTASGDIHLRTTKTTMEITPSNSDAGGVNIEVGFVAGGQGPLKFSMGGTERARITSTGDFSTNHNILLNRTTASSQGEVLRKISFVNSYASSDYIASIEAIREFYDNNIGLRFNVQVGGVNGAPVSLPAMYINQNGHITAPYTPAFVAYGAPATLSNNAVIVWGSTALNRGSVYNTTNGRFTAPVAGLYQFFASVRIENSAAATAYHRVTFSHNGVGIEWSKSRLNSRPATGYYTHASNDHIVGMAAGDYVEVKLESSTASFATAAPNEHVFYGYLIG